MLGSEMVTTDTMGGKRAVIFRELMPEIPSTTYATFGLYKYPAKFIPQVIAYALKTYGHSSMSVFDCFAGYGTVGTIARLYGNDYELWDLNPLLKHLHSVAVMQPVRLDTETFVRKMMAHSESFCPNWSNITYWYPDQFLPMISNAWGFYHSLCDEKLQQVLLIPLLKTTRSFSYNDEKRQKLSQSPLARNRVNTLANQDWQEIFFKKVASGIDRVIRGLEEYQSLKPRPVNATVRAGIDGLTSNLTNNHDILITSPPYLQAQEYIRASKMDLFWLGYSEDKIKALGKKEFPYQDVPRITIHSPTYHKCLEDIKEPHMIQVFERYFSGVLGTLSRLQERISKHLLLFLGPATMRTRPIPIDRIFIEHFETMGWEHEITIVDTIVARAMFFYKLNPATGTKDQRMSTEHLVVLSKK